MDMQPPHPGRRYYLLAAVSFLFSLLGVGGFVWVLFTGVSGIAGALRQVVVPGTASLPLTKPGGYTVFYEQESVVGNKTYSTGGSLSGLQLTMTGPGGEDIAVTPVGSNQTYEVAGRRGRAVWNFDVAKSGTYTLRAAYPPGQQGPQVVLAVGQGFAGGLAGTLVGSFAALGFAALCGVGTIAFVLIGYTKNKAAAAPAAGVR
jgi:hypothetical protein